MRGTVEIYLIEDDKQILLHQENNLIVDGAGKTIVDALTAFDGLSGIPSSSALLDVSNYTIQAITFGAPSASYTKNIHDTTYPLLVSGLSNTAFTVLQDGLATSTYTPYTGGSPRIPNPVDIKLELSASPSGSWSGITIQLPYTTSAGVVIEDQGHHLNIAGIGPLYAQFGASAPIAVLLGSYAMSSNTGASYLISSINQLNPGTGVPSSVAASAALGATGTYNGRQLIDYHGFIHMISPSANSNINFTSINGSGLQLSTQSTFSSTGELVYGTRLAQTDCICLNFNGGVYNIGMWTIDLSKSIQAGNFPPYSFSQLNNPRKYRLFCKKTFTKNIVQHSLSSISAMQIVWRIKFL